LEKAEREGNLKGIRVCPGGPSVSHLLFANDSLMLFRADRGMRNNYKASYNSMRTQKKQEVMQELHIQKETMSEKYLRLPVYIGKFRTNTFAYLKERIWQRIQGWKK
jgi:hypothetical protein